ncbi:MAG: PilZ domain-containing protein [Candidatus Omnitrophica bacterium]|nr:PilZ domain-containing protein [Candidatus Omnitrophota bacterium]MDD5236804.1 PilZ domain-containing protein [Candidatus Omnitrophota bacterium]MDD5610956.1 PilZ domain-containing protein [Candidatus Omnitrophota bacterium]
MVRVYPRYTADGSVSLKVPDNHLNGLFDANLENISFGGFAMNCVLKVNIDTDISFKLKSCLLNEPIQGKARIRHVREDGYKTAVYKMGAEFVDIDKDALRYFISRLEHYSKTEQKAHVRKQIMRSIEVPF